MVGSSLPFSQELGRASCLWMLRSRWGARTVLGILGDTPVSAKVWLQAIGARSYAGMMNEHQKEGGLVVENTMWEM